MICGRGLGAIGGRTTNEGNELRSESKAMLPASAPECATNHLRLVEGVVQVTRDFLDVEAPEPKDCGTRLRRTGTGKDGEHPEGIFELGEEDVLMNPVFKPPVSFPARVTLSGGSEADSPGAQRNGSSRRILSA
jgi:hypothetical protein